MDLRGDLIIDGTQTCVSTYCRPEQVKGYIETIKNTCKKYKRKRTCSMFV